ncbi:MAG: hypothetical protein KAT65_14525 [Methanophagales archaeon]|nr:hypothetical protein [Methanophagales archaeon]
MNNVTRVIFGFGIVLCISVSVLALSTVGVPAGSLNQSDEEKWNDGGHLYGTNRTEYIHVYDFSTGAGTDKWAFRNETTGCSATQPNIEFTTVQYEKINTSDDTRQDDKTSQDTYYAAHRFNITIIEDASDVRKINVTWEGIGDHGGSATDGAKLYIYNFSAGAGYEQLDSTTSNTEQTLAGEKTSSISSYINVNNVTILVNQTSAHTSGPGGRASHIKTDYVKLELHVGD